MILDRARRNAEGAPVLHGLGLPPFWEQEAERAIVRDALPQLVRDRCRENVTTLAGTPLYQQTFLDTLERLWDARGPMGMGRQVLCGRFGREVLESWRDDERGRSSATLPTDFGDIALLMHAYALPSTLLVVNPEHLRLVGERDARPEDYPLGQGFFLRLEEPHAHGAIVGFSTTRADYATLTMR